jgi:PTH1 family peptidyl-tRNA hydrolase
LKNIEQTLGTQDYARLRFGIGSEFAKGQQVDYVLGNFTQDEFKALPQHMDRAIEMILSFCTIGPERTMNFYNN